jgi:hypothetical protein
MKSFEPGSVAQLRCFIRLAPYERGHKHLSELLRMMALPKKSGNC